MGERGAKMFRHYRNMTKKLDTLGLLTVASGLVLAVVWGLMY